MKAFVIMPFQEPYNSYYRDIYKSALELCGYEVNRVDEIYGPTAIIDDIARSIKEADVLLCDLSTRNANVLYELGLAHAIEKPVILVAEEEPEGTKLPFDVGNIRTLIYRQKDVRWAEALKERIRSSVDEVKKGNYTRKPFTVDLWPDSRKLLSRFPTDFVRMEGGTFKMGSPDSEPERKNDEVQHDVTVSPFYMCKYVVTQAEYEALMGTNPSKYKGDNLPVERVSWYEAVEYCIQRSIDDGFKPAYQINKNQKDPKNKNGVDDSKWLVTWDRSANGYRLPTEAEWEYACRAGTITPFSTGDNITTDEANYDGKSPYNKNAKGEYRDETTRVRSFAPNPWGLHNMHGNVLEWCWDWYGLYDSNLQLDPMGAPSGQGRVERGGCWKSFGQALRSANRQWLVPSNQNDTLGFRLARDAE